MPQIDEGSQGKYAVLGERPSEVLASLQIVYFGWQWAIRVNVKLGGVNLVPDPSAVRVLTDQSIPTIVIG